MIRASFLTPIACSVYLANIASGVSAQEVRVYGDGPCIGRLLITNHRTTTVEQNTLHDVGGVEVNVIYVSTPNHVLGVDPRDIVTITTPDGFMAVPSDLLLDEGATAEVLICEAVIG